MSFYIEGKSIDIYIIDLYYSLKNPTWVDDKRLKLELNKIQAMAVRPGFGTLTCIPSQFVHSTMSNIQNIHWKNVHN